jgi:hypothetical protein
MAAKPTLGALVLTVSEIADVVGRLENRPCTTRQARYLLAGLLHGDVAPQRGRTRLYGPIDVALMRLALRLESQGISAWVARVVLAYCGDEIRAAWASNRPVALSVRGVMGTIEPANREEMPGAVARVPLRSVLVGIDAAIRRERRARPTVWMWRPRMATALAKGIA